MPSTLLSEAEAIEAPASAVADLLVLWQHPESREISPIGRLEHNGSSFRFVYTVAAAEIEGFRPLPGLPRLGQAYRSEELPLVFGQRVLARTRADYPDYIRSLGLDPEQATPWEQIVRSGGHREGDTLQFMEIPTVRAGRAQATFLGNGVRWISVNELWVDGTSRRVSRDEHETALRSLSPGTSLSTVPELANPQDRDSSLIVAGETPVARIPRVLAASVCELLGAGDVPLRVVRLGDPDGPAHLRLTVSLDVPAPAGFAFDAAGRWAPYATN